MSGSSSSVGSLSCSNTLAGIPRFLCKDRIIARVRGRFRERISDTRVLGRRREGPSDQQPVTSAQYLVFSEESLSIAPFTGGGEGIHHGQSVTSGTIKGACPEQRRRAPPHVQFFFDLQNDRARRARSTSDSLLLAGWAPALCRGGGLLLPYGRIQFFSDVKVRTPYRSCS